jgi:hypothetical protein
MSRDLAPFRGTAGGILPPLALDNQHFGPGGTKQLGDLSLELAGNGGGNLWAPAYGLFRAEQV